MNPSENIPEDDISVLTDSKWKRVSFKKGKDRFGFPSAPKYISGKQTSQEVTEAIKEYIKERRIEEDPSRLQTGPELKVNLNTMTNKGLWGGIMHRRRSRRHRTRKTMKTKKNRRSHRHSRRRRHSSRSHKK